LRFSTAPARPRPAAPSALGVRAGARTFIGSNDNGGTSYQQGTEVSVGASVHLLFLTVDYSYINYELTPMQYLSMGATF